MKSPPSPPPSLSSAQRIETRETFDEKAHRFNEHAAIFTADGRAFEVQEPRIRSFFAWEQIYLVEMELLERSEQYLLPFQVSIRWEAMFGHDALPNDKTLYRMARTAIGQHLEAHRTARGLSCHASVIRLQFPEQRARLDIHVHNY